MERHFPKSRPGSEIDPYESSNDDAETSFGDDESIGSGDCSIRSDPIRTSSTVGETLAEYQGKTKLWIGKDYANFIVKDFSELDQPLNGAYLKLKFNLFLNLHNLLFY